MKVDQRNLGIDWAWVKKELFTKERLPSLAKDGPRHIIHTAVDYCLKKAKSLAEPVGLSEKKAVVELTGDSVRLEGNILFSGNRLSSYIKGATDTCLFVVTIGDGMEKEASAFMAKKEPLYGYLLDRIGSLAVESLAEIFEEKLRGRQHASKRSCSMRLSPGYCDWPIEEQVIMAKALDFPKAGIRLTKKCMMIPRKSISAMVAMGPKGLFEKGRPQCLACDREDCDYRRVSQATD